MYLTNSWTQVQTLAHWEVVGVALTDMWFIWLHRTHMLDHNIVLGAQSQKYTLTFSLLVIVFSFRDKAFGLGLRSSCCCVIWSPVANRRALWNHNPSPTGTHFTVNPVWVQLKQRQTQIIPLWFSPLLDFLLQGSVPGSTAWLLIHTVFIAHDLSSSYPDVSMIWESGGQLCHWGHLWVNF